VEPDQEIRVLRFIEYRYETVEAMEEDMARWTTSNPPRSHRATGWRMRMSSAHLPPQVVRGLFPAENGPEPAQTRPRPGEFAVDDLGED
jgi:hypothetical protein